MEVAVAGGHGKVARRLTRLLVAGSERVRGLIRNPAHGDDLLADGAIPIVCDLETAGDEDIDAAVSGADAIVFAAGAGPGSGAGRKLTVDYGAAKRLVDAALRVGIRRYVMISSVGTDDPPDGEDVFAVYLRAKARAEAELRAAGLDHTIVRPGSLTDKNGTGKVRIERQVPRGEITRDDVADVLADVLHAPGTARRTFEVIGGETPVREAVAAAEALIPPDG